MHPWSFRGGWTRVITYVSLATKKFSPDLALYSGIRTEKSLSIDEQIEAEFFVLTVRGGPI